MMNCSTQPCDSVNEESGTPDFIEVYRPPLKITVVYNMSARRKVNVEYYSNAKRNLMFYHYCTKGGCKNGRNFFVSPGEDY